MRIFAYLKNAFLPDDPRLARLRFEQLLLVSNNMAPSRYATPIIALILAFVFSRWSDDVTIISWLLAVCGSVWLASRESRKFRESDEDFTQLRKWTLRLFCHSAVVSIIWASMGVLFWVPGDQLNHVMILLFMLASIAGTAAMASASPAICTANLVPYVLVAILQPLREADPFYVWLTVLSALYSAFMISVAFKINETSRTTLLLREDKDDLIEQLQNAKNESDVARIRAEASSRAKSDFLANMSHELRTPLNAILGFSEVIKDEIMGPGGNATYRGYAGDIHTSGVHLLKLINDVLDLSRIEAGRHTFTSVEIRLAEVAGEVMKFFELKAKESGIALVTDVPAGLALMGDDRGVKQVLINLVSNAIKFTPTGGTISILANVNERACVSLSVCDTGSGIDQQQILHVFESFGQGRHDITVRDRGTGLGLPIVKGIVEAHGGTVRLDSQVGVGTMFTATFPATRTINRVLAVNAA